jgi:GTP cyclohydrolase IA
MMQKQVPAYQIERGVDQDRVADAIRELLIAIGEDPNRPGIKETPARVARYWAEFIDYNPGSMQTTFDDTKSESPVTVSGMRVWSLCEHHLMPFWADITVSYIPHGRVIGLSKLARIAHFHAHSLQLQERLVAGIAETVQSLTGSRDVMVLASGEHSCMIARGIKTPGLMTSADIRGAYLADAHLRADVSAQHRGGGRG